MPLLQITKIIEKIKRCNLGHGGHREFKRKDKKYYLFLKYIQALFSLLFSVGSVTIQFVRFAAGSRSYMV